MFSQGHEKLIQPLWFNKINLTQKKRWTEISPSIICFCIYFIS